MTETAHGTMKEKERCVFKQAPGRKGFRSWAPTRGASRSPHKIVIGTHNCESRPSASVPAQQTAPRTLRNAQKQLVFKPACKSSIGISYSSRPPPQTTWRIWNKTSELCIVKSKCCIAHLAGLYVVRPPCDRSFL